MTNFEWLTQSSNLIDFLYDLTDIAKNEKDVFNVLKNWDIPRIPNHTGQWAIAKWLQLKHKEGEECLVSTTEDILQTVKWEYDEYFGAFRCSNCQGLMVRNVYNFCPWCGAKMENASDEKIRE